MEEYYTEYDIEAILEDYHKKQLMETMTGPAVSLVLHIIVLFLMMVYVISKPRDLTPPITVTIVEVEPVVLQPEVIPEIETVDEPLEDDAPDVPNPTPTDSVGAEDSIMDTMIDDAPETADMSDMSEVLDVKITNSPFAMPMPMGGRTAKGRSRLRRKHGGSGAGNRSVNRALRWLARVQNENGSWGNNHPAHTGLALLVFLGHGETPLSEQYGITVQNAMRWLVNYASSTDLSNRAHKRPGGYSHGIATYAIAESYAMTKIPFMRTAMENAIAIIIDGQQPSGGFDYAYAKGERWDMSVSGWNFQALKAAYVAGSTNEKLPDAIKKSVMFCRRTAFHDSGFYYSDNSKRSNMIGVGTVALQLLGYSECKEALKPMKSVLGERFDRYRKAMEQPASWNELAGENLYGWYYDTQAVFNSYSHGHNKNEWKDWRKTFETVLVRSQNPEGYWETNGRHGIGAADIPGRVLATCLCALQLEVYYRYLPSFDIKKMDRHKINDINNVGLLIETE